MKSIPEPNPGGICMCGCGNPAPIASRNRYDLGHVKDKPICYIRGHFGREDVLLRFLDKVKKTDSCWLWTGAINQHGYGWFNPYGSPITASRMSYQLFVGDIPEGLIVRHRCDNPPCVNPEHLLLGTYQDNTNDMVERKRIWNGGGMRGEKHPRAKLTAAQVAGIRARYAKGGVTLTSLGKEFNVHYSTIACVIKGKNWREVS